MWVAPCVLAVAACDKREPAGEPAGRVNGAKTEARRATTPAAFCDVHPTAIGAPAFAWPALDATAPPATAGKWRWINVWATWCKPCLEEMPRLVRWRDKLGLDLVFVSVDESAAVIETFRKDHPATPPSLRLADPEQANTWFSQLGLEGNPPIPIHLFVDPAGKVRCARAGGVNEPDLAVIEQLLAE
ncbi:MAG: TlpA disulfide reductase family protein [Kofleriaceae bacterium]